MNILTVPNAAEATCIVTTYDGRPTQRIEDLALAILALIFSE